MTDLELKLAELKANLASAQSLLALEPTWERMQQLQGYLHSAISLSFRIQYLYPISPKPAIPVPAQK